MGLRFPEAQANFGSLGSLGRELVGGASWSSAAVCDTGSRLAARVPRDTNMVRAGAMGTHLSASCLDIFGDLRKMNKRQVMEARVGGVPRCRDHHGCRGSGLPG